MPKFILIGLNDFGFEIARTLTSNGAEVTAIDRNRKKIVNISPLISHSLLIQEEELSHFKGIDFENFDSIIVLLTEDAEYTLACLVSLKNLNVRNVLVCVESQKHEKLVSMFGDFQIVRFDKEIANLLSHKLLNQ